MSFVRTTRRGTVAVVTLTRPPANAMDAARSQRAVRRDRTTRRRAGCRGIVITGSGGVFSAGLDLKAIGALDAAGQEALIEALNRAFLAVYGVSPLGRRCDQWACHRRRARAGSVL